MKKYRIEYLEPETGLFLDADTTQLYEAETELDALKLFADKRKKDIDVEKLEIASEDPFILKISGWTQAADRSKFEVVESQFEYIAKEATP